MASAEAKKCWARFVSEYSDALCRLGEVLLAFASGVLTFVTFGTAYWTVEGVEGDSPQDFTEKRHCGLWQTCNVLPDPDIGCNPIPLSGPGYLLSARFFMCLGLVGGVAAWIISIVGLLQHKARWLLIAAGCYGVQAFLMLIGLSSYSAKFHTDFTCVDDDSDSDDENLLVQPSWSYDVGWVAMVISVLCALYFISVGLYRFRHPNDPISHPGVSKVYAPLAQFESNESDDDDDDF